MEDNEILLIQHFWAKAIKRPNGCIEWMGSTSDGRGCIGNGPLARMYGTRAARHIAWILSEKKRPIGYTYIKMKCGLLTCINSDHMEWKKYEI